MPQKLINPAKVTEVFVHLNETPDNHALYSELARAEDVAHDVPGVSLPPGYRIVRMENRLADSIPQTHFELALLNDLVEEVAYYNRVIFQPDRFLNCRPVTQILVWRTLKPKHRAVVQNFARLIFMEYLLPRYDVIVSDQNQTREGLSFWLSRMYDALELGLHLYAYDMLSCELRPLTTERELELGETWLWGDAEHYQNRLAIISRSPLPVTL
ncbi:TPA: hypothetical protein MB364_000808 [Klebsiella variicola subsp. variicola]|nr:hypothetical protein [Klebsiella variicola subsp. variicola]